MAAGNHRYWVCHAMAAQVALQRRDEVVIQCVQLLRLGPDGFELR